MGHKLASEDAHLISNGKRVEADMPIRSRRTGRWVGIARPSQSRSPPRGASAPAPPLAKEADPQEHCGGGARSHVAGGAASWSACCLPCPCLFSASC
jgi:hypothetical protein